MNSLRIVLCLIMFVLVVGSGCAQTPNNKVLRQEVRGNVIVSTDAIIAATQLRPGMEYSDEKRKLDAESIHGLGLFKTAVAKANPTPEGWIVIYEVEENPLISTISVTGNTVVATSDILQVMQMKPGQVLNFNLLTFDARAIRLLYQDKGYYSIAIGKFEPADDDPSKLELEIIEVRIMRINIVGNKRTKTHVIRQDLRTKEGDVFNINIWRKDIYRVFNRGFFEDIQTSQPRNINDDPSQIELDLVVKERRSGSVNAGIGYDQKQGLFGLIDLQDINFRGEGQTVGTHYQRTATGRNSFEVNFADPVIDKHRTGFNVRAYSRLITRFSDSFLTSGENEQYDERREGGELSISRPFGEYNRGMITFRGESIATSDIDLSGDYILQDGSVYSLSLGYSRNTRDLDINPSSGSFYQLRAEYGLANLTKVGGLFNDPALLGDHNFMKYSAEARYYWSLSGKRKKPDQLMKVLALRVYFGHLEGTVPFWEQYFVGGSESLRGYPEDRYWGNNAFISTLEFRMPVLSSFSAVFFVDCSTAWGGYDSVNNYTQKNSFNPQLGFGVGVNFQTPMGPLRLDVGFNPDGNSRTHLRVGNVF